MFKGNELSNNNEGLWSPATPWDAGLGEHVTCHMFRFLRPMTHIPETGTENRYQKMVPVFQCKFFVSVASGIKISGTRNKHGIKTFSENTEISRSILLSVQLMIPILILKFTA